jgi:hypothetical protein
LARKQVREKLLNPLKRKKLLRKRIPLGEVLFGIGFLLFLVVVVVWVGWQRDRFDPADRDISFAVLEASAVEDTLYRRPLRRWSESGPVVGGAGEIDLGIFPQGLLADGWSLDGRVESYDPSNVYEKINGAAEQYLAFGFQALHYATVARDGRYLTIELYDQGDFRNTLGIFAAQRDASRTVERNGEVFYYATPVGAVGGFQNFYFKISGDRAEAAVTEKARQLLEVVARIPGSAGAVPGPYTLLTDTMGLGFDEVTYQKTNVFQYDFLTDVWFGAVGGEGDVRYFLHEAGDEDRSAGLFRRLLDEQSYEYEVLERETDRVYLRHRFLSTVFALARNGDVLFGVDGAEDLGRSRAALERLGEAIDRGTR